MSEENSPVEDGSVVVATDDDQIRLCYPVMAQLRPAFNEHEFVELVTMMQREQGYSLVYVLVNGRAGAAAGFRTGISLAWGRYLYVDDLVTDSGMRSLGLGQRLINWLFDETTRRGCEAIHLDSGVHRFDAHRFYMRNGLEIRSHHFSRIVG
ncbi:MAG: GNAT family N-acetyltransferase [Acidobacteria bacterium]|nr:MAG: GNAT family N-acetyltransferase [Acidobacteriota bacterium]REK00258.1 MAG: GNAT family N-acetyltransferase [Acidobacteriota bacterium]